MSIRPWWCGWSEGKTRRQACRNLLDGKPLSETAAQGGNVSLFNPKKDVANNLQCGKLRSAGTIFKSISAQSPPLEYYPAAHRVTFLYYLGRYLFANNSFYLARNALQEAYNQCHVQCLKQKRLILIYLISCNIIIGRFPSLQILQKPEAQDLYNIFFPACLIIRSGDYLKFREHFNVGSLTGQWFL